MKYKKKKVAEIAKIRLRKQQIKKYKANIKKYRENPSLFVEEMLNIKLTAWQKIFLDKFSKYKDKIIYMKR